MRSHEGIVALFASLWASARLGVIMLGALVLTIALGVYIAWPAVQANLAPAREVAFTPLDAKEKAARESRADATLRSAGERVINRSPFYPLKPQAPEVPKNLPREYGGPKLIAIYGDTAWFEDAKRLRLGEAPVDGLEVVALTPPWSARVRWRGGEFNVTLFERPSDVLTSGGFTRDAFTPSRVPAMRPPPRSIAPPVTPSGPGSGAVPVPAAPANPAAEPVPPPAPPDAPPPPPDGGPPIASILLRVDPVQSIASTFTTRRSA